MKTRSLKTGGTLIENNNLLLCHFPVRRLVLSTSPVQGGFLYSNTIFYYHDSNSNSDDLFTDELQKKVQRKIIKIIKIMNETGSSCEQATGFFSAVDPLSYAYHSLYENRLIIEVIVVAEVADNALRAGDLRQESTMLHQGAIQLLVMTNAKMNPGNMAQALLTITEAKCAVLQELAVISSVTHYPATGTGNDGVILVTDPTASLCCNEAGSGSPFGELLARTVKRALKETLVEQSKLSPWRQSMIEERLWRLGLDGICSADWPPFSTTKVQIILAISQAVWQEYCWGLIGIDGLYQFFAFLENPLFQPIGLKISKALHQKIAATVTDREENS